MPQRSSQTKNMSIWQGTSQYKVPVSYLYFEYTYHNVTNENSEIPNSHVGLFSFKCFVVLEQNKTLTEKGQVLGIPLHYYKNIFKPSCRSSPVTGCVLVPNSFTTFTWFDKEWNRFWLQHTYYAGRDHLLTDVSVILCIAMRGWQLY